LPYLVDRIMEEKIPAGKQIIEAERWQTKFWTNLVGLSKKRIEDTTKKQEQSVHNNREYYGGYVGDIVLGSAILLGVLVGYIKKRSDYTTARREAMLINAIDNLENDIRDLTAPAGSLEKSLEVHLAQNPKVTAQKPPETRE